uniref:Uncharacterized protein n=1 Tax=Myoviridae sp. ct0jJ30 TaxID=2825014 RepID=A0A8S5PJ69_9CAUD|nr:MAG TPA: hypothetical protein [Myoviridae sp. ct0jJ30]
MDRLLLVTLLQHQHLIAYHGAFLEVLRIQNGEVIMFRYHLTHGISMMV